MADLTLARRTIDVNNGMSCLRRPAALTQPHAQQDAVQQLQQRRGQPYRRSRHDQPSTRISVTLSRHTPVTTLQHAHRTFLCALRMRTWHWIRQPVSGEVTKGHTGAMFVPGRKGALQGGKGEGERWHRGKYLTTAFLQKDECALSGFSPHCSAVLVFSFCAFFLFLMFRIRAITRDVNQV